MASPIDKLIVQIEADTKQLRKELNKVHKQLDKTKKKTKGANDTFGKMKKALIAIGAVQIASKIIEINRTFEDLEATLRAVTGSAEAAEKSFELIRAFTSSTTFQIEEVAQAFITLKQAGIIPTSDALMDFGNFAAGMGKSITQLAQAAFNATTGEMEMLKQFGVIARQQGDQITVTFANQTETIERSGDAIVEYLRSIGREKFSTAIEERFNTLSGAISNLNDQVSEFAVSMGDGRGGIGMRQSLIDLAKATGSLIETLRPLGEVLGSLIGALTNCVTAVIKLADALLVIGRAVTDITKYYAIFKGLVDGSIDSFDDFKKTVRGGTGDVDELDKQLLKLLATASDFKDSFTSQEMTDFKLFEKLKKQVDASRNTINDLIKNDLTRLKAIIDKSIDAQLRLSLQFGPIQGGIESERNRIIKDLLGVDTVDEFLSDVKKVTDVTKTELDILNDVFKEATGDIGALDTIYKVLNESMAEGVLTQEQATAKLREFLETTGPYGKALAQIGSEVEGLASSFSDDLTDALLNGENALESFKSFAQNVVQAVISAFMELMVIQPIVNAILGSFGMSTPKGGVKPKGYSPAGGLAGGGSMQGNMPRLVGERGPEIFVPNTGGTIMNNMNSKNAMGGGNPVNIYQTVNFATGIVPTVRAEVTKMMPQIADVTKAAVQESAMRGGNFRRSLVGG